ncbi:hypothetical protein QOZ80_8BG0650310 [Eleusine coracana subsp. coracana]|nr:hypothetical protein QOZ80_8BG0650310 [Eleusine coracana subsp. coracana]
MSCLVLHRFCDLVADSVKTDKGFKEGLNMTVGKNCRWSITLSPYHYYGHTLHHPKDAEFLNQPLQNYIQMQTIFASSADDTKHEGTSIAN